MSRALHWDMVRCLFSVCVAAIALAVILNMLTGCPQPSAAAQNATEAAYGADLLRCVDKATTLAESKACREQVDLKWGIVHTIAKDGGQ